MKSFAAHYVLFPGEGFLQQHVVELDDSAIVKAIYPLIEEIEAVSWIPGVILLLPADRVNELDYARISALFQHNVNTLPELPEKYNTNLFNCNLVAIHLYPFDLLGMKPDKTTLWKVLS